MEPSVKSKVSTKPKDVLIAVMGITGSGKSSFISHCTDEPVPVGNQLQSRQFFCSPTHTSTLVYQTNRAVIHTDTQEVRAYQYKYAAEGNIYLIDTPGFDDTNRDDADVLKDLADWLTTVYEKRTDLRGIVYLHRITDVRMQRAANKNLFMFKKLCGRDGMKNIILGTTMWENVRREDGERREAELVETPEFWGNMIEHGSQIARHQNSSGSARRIIDRLIQSTKPNTFAIQSEMVNDKLELNETSAGKELSSLQDEERKNFQRQLADLESYMKEAKMMQDKESQEQIRKLQKEKSREIAKLQEQQEKMAISLDRLHSQKRQEWKELKRQLEAEIRDARNEQERQRRIIERYEQQKATRSLVRKLSSDSLEAQLEEMDYVKHTHRVEEKKGHTKGHEEVSLSLRGPYFYFCGPVSNERYANHSRTGVRHTEWRKWMKLTIPPGAGISRKPWSRYLTVPLEQYVWFGWDQMTPMYGNTKTRPAFCGRVRHSKHTQPIRSAHRDRRSGY